MQHNIKTNCVFFISQLFFTRVSNVLSKCQRVLTRHCVLLQCHMCYDHPRGGGVMITSAPCAMIVHLVDSHHIAQLFNNCHSPTLTQLELGVIK